MNVLIENGAIRLGSTGVAIATVIFDSMTGKHMIWIVNKKGILTSQYLPEGTTVQISVDKSKEPIDKVA